MKSWQDMFTTIKDWIQQHPTVSRWGGIAMIVVLIGSLVLNQNNSRPESVSLFDSRELTSDEIGLIQVAFGKSGLNEYEIRGSQIQVPHSDRANYLKSLSEHGAIPQDLLSTRDNRSTFEFFQTRAQQREQQIDRKKQTIRDMVMQLRFVDRAIVDYDETRGATPFESMQRTAVVNVTPTGNRVLEHPEIKAIRDTVRGAVAGLQSENITIIDTFASKSHSGVLTTGHESMQPHTLTKIQAERKYEDKIRSALTAYPGVRVNVEVGIDPVVRRIRDQRKIQGEPLVVERTIRRETSGRVPGTSPSVFRNVFSQGANRQARIEPSPSQTKTSETTQSMANGTFETTETAGPVVSGVSVSIGIPERCVNYFVNQNNYGQELANEMFTSEQERVLEQLQHDIQQKVQPLVPVRTEHDVAQSQIVVTMDREIPMAAEVAAVRETTFATNVLGQLQERWHWVLVGCLGLFVLAFIRPIGRNNHHGMMRSPQHSQQQPEMPTTAATENTPPGPAVFAAGSNLTDSRSPEITFIADTGNTNPTNSNSLPQRIPIKDSRKTSGPNIDSNTELEIKGQLDQWCRDNPIAAAATIRQWLDRKAG